MEIKELKKLLNEKLANETKIIEEAKLNLKEKEEELNKTNKQLDETIIKGKTENAEELIEKKALLINKIEYYKNFINKRSELSIITEEERRNYIKVLDTEINDFINKDKARANELMTELKQILEKDEEKINEINALANQINNKFTKSGQTFNNGVNVDGFRNKLKFIVNNYFHR